MGKARQAAKTEMEKLKMADMSCLELIKEAAKMLVPSSFVQQNINLCDFWSYVLY